VQYNPCCQLPTGTWKQSESLSEQIEAGGEAAQARGYQADASSRPTDSSEDMPELILIALFKQMAFTLALADERKLGMSILSANTLTE
jgi:hypothetical protein